MKQDIQIKLTKHARERLRSFNISPFDAYDMIRDGVWEKPPFDKEKKYKDPATTYRNGSVLFTGLFTEDKATGAPIFLVLTVFDQRMYLPERYYRD